MTLKKTEIKRPVEELGPQLTDEEKARQISLDKLTDFYNNPDPERLQYLDEILQNENLDKQLKVHRMQYADSLINKIDLLIEQDEIITGDNVKQIKDLKSNGYVQVTDRRNPEDTIVKPKVKPKAKAKAKAKKK